MDTRKILSELKSERDRINDAIAALEALSGREAQSATTAAKSVAAPAAGRPKKRNLTAAGRRRLSESMKKRWAERKKAAKGSKTA